jgi:hypothetical protein
MYNFEFFYFNIIIFLNREIIPFTSTQIMNIQEGITITPVFKEEIKVNPLFKKETEITKANFGEAIQQAIEIEIATIPVYLYTYYSINRTPNQATISDSIVQALVKNGMPPIDAEVIAKNLSADIMVFANKAGALIMSVAIEEMLHMALSSNLKQALVGMPILTGKSPSKWPTCLPGHIPSFEINKAPLSLKQVMTFLEIESPTPLPEKKLLTAIPYRTIGEFYDMIKEYISNNKLSYNAKRPQLVPKMGYYASNNIDTTFYDKEHKARLVNAEDSGDLVAIHDMHSALMAIDIIVEQGEGNAYAPGLTSTGTVDCKLYPADYDDANFQEFSHFEKFARIYCQYEHMNHKLEQLGIGKDVGTYFVNKIPTNPLTEYYPAKIQALSNLLNAVYTYIFVMTEGCYRPSQSKHTQYEIFMFGIHKSMIFILNSLCGDIMQLKYLDKDGIELLAAPTFENYPFDRLSTPKAQIIALYTTAIDAGLNESYLGARIHDLPDVAL